MFRRSSKGKKGIIPNELGDQSEPNSLSWASELEEEELAENELEEGEFEDEEGEEGDEDREVDPDAIARDKKKLQAELQRQAEEFGLTGFDPLAAYGPSGEDIVEMLDQLNEIDDDTAEGLAEAWTANDPAELDVLERDLERKHRYGKMRYELSAADDAVGTWLSGRLSEDSSDPDLWRLVAQAARGAMTAVILADDLDDIDYDLLYGAWGEVMDAEEEEAEGEGEAEEEDKEPFGPNTPLVLDLLERLGKLKKDKTYELTAAWKEQDKSDLRQAHKAVQALAEEDVVWRNQVKAAQTEASKWTRPDADYVPSKAALPDEARAAREAALPAVVDAVTALVLADLLEPEDAETLYAPWMSVVGKPKLPEFEEDE